MAEYSGKSIDFDCIGLDLSIGDDKPRNPRKWPFLKNVRRFQDGRLTPRRGRLASVSYFEISGGPIHSMHRLDNGDDFAFFFGDNERVMWGRKNVRREWTTALGTLPVAKSTGWPGTRLTFVEAKPNQDRDNWLYISSSGKAEKYDVDGVANTFGIPAPTAPPDVVPDKFATVQFNQLSDGGMHKGTIEGVDLPTYDGLPLSRWWGGVGVGTPYIQGSLDTSSLRAALTMNWAASLRNGTTDWVTVEVTSTTLYDQDVVGAGTVYPGAVRGIGPGTMIHETGLTQNKRFIVSDVFRESKETLINNIVFDGASAKTSSIYLEKFYDQFVVGALVYASGGPGRSGTVYYGLITSVHKTGSGGGSLRVVWNSTAVGAWYFGTIPSIRFQRPTGTQPGVMYADSMRFKSTGEGTFTIWGPGAVAPWNGGPVDGTTYTDTGEGQFRTVSEDDYVHLSVMMSKPELIKEIKISLDLVDPELNEPGGEYIRSRSGYYFIIRASDLSAIVSDDATAVDTEPEDDRTDEEKAAARQAILDRIADNRGLRQGARTQSLPSETGYRENNPRDWIVADAPDPDAPIHNKAGTGGWEWKEVWLRVKDMVVIGEKLPLHEISGMKIAVTTIEILDGAGAPKECNIRLGSFWIGGGGPQDVGSPTKGRALPYYYRYRYRNSSTGAASNYSPPYRGGWRARRQAHYITYVGNSDTANIDRVDFERWGGTNPAWAYVGSETNTGAGLFTWIDNVLDSSARENILISEGNANFQPWPTIGQRVEVTGLKAAGTTLYAATPAFSTSWSPGTICSVDPNNNDGIVVTSIYRVIDSQRMELADPIPSSYNTAVATLTIEQPILIGQTLPIIFGPWHGMIMGLGDPNNPGRLYRTRGYNVDATLPEYWVDLTDAGDPLENGLIWNDRCYVWTATRMYEVTFDPSTRSLLQYAEIPGGKGLSARYALAANRSGMFWLAKDGVYSSTGSSAVLRSEDLERLFQTEGRTGEYSFGSFSATVEEYGMVDPTNLGNSFSFYEDRLYWISPCVTNAAEGQQTFILDLSVENAGNIGWWCDTHASLSAILIYGDDRSVKGTGGKEASELYYTYLGSGVGLVGGGDDWGTTFELSIQTPFFDAGSPKVQKRWGDLTVEGRGSNWGLSPTYLLYDNSKELTVSLGNVLGFSNTAMSLASIDLNTGDGFFARSIALRIRDTAFSGAGYRDEILRWEPSWIEYPEDTKRRGTDFYDQGVPKRKYVRGVIIEADTKSQTINFDIIKDGMTIGATVAVNHAGRKIQEYSVTPFNSALLSLRPQASTSGLKLFKHVWILDEYPFLATTYTAWDDMGGLGPKWVEGVIVKADSANSSVDLTVQLLLEDGTTVTRLLSTCVHNGLSIKRYSFTPTMARQARIVPSNGTIGIFDAEFVFEPLAALEDTSPTKWDDLGHLGPKYIRGMRLKADSYGASITLNILKDGGTQAQALAASVHTNRTVKIYEWSPFVAHEVRIDPSGRFGILEYEFIFAPIVDTQTEWDDLKSIGPKHIRGVRIEADTFGSPASIQVQRDAGTVEETLVATHTGRTVIPYYWDPWLAREVRLTPVIAESVAIFQYEFIFDTVDTVQTVWDDLEHLGPKYIRGMRLKADSFASPATIQVQRDGGTVEETIVATFAATDREVQIFEWTEWVAHEVRLVVTAGSCAIIEYEFISEPAVDTKTEWDNMGSIGAKFVQGLRLEADTFGSPATVYIESDGGVVEQTIVVNNSGRTVIPYSWEPFITHQIRIRPAIAESIAILKYEFIWEPEPELTTHWESQETTHDLRGWMHIRNMLISVMLSDTSTPLTMTITADGVDYSYLINPRLDQGLLQKIPIEISPIKGRQFRYQITAPSSSPFRLYRRNCEVRVKAWGSPEGYVMAQPFGDDSRAAGARI